MALPSVMRMRHVLLVVEGLSIGAGRSRPASAALFIISSTGSRVINAADTILTVTKPPQPIGRVVDGGPVQVTRGIDAEQSPAIGHESSRPRVTPRHEQPRVTSTAESRGTPVR